MDNTPAEIYANVRNKALEDAAQLCDKQQTQAEKRAELEYMQHNTGWAMGAINCARDIRALKVEAA